MKSIVDIVIDKKHWFIFFASFLFFVIINQIRADFREHLYGKYSDNSAHTITSAQIWFNEKPWNVKFSSILSFKSIQYQNLNPEIHERHIGGLSSRCDGATPAGSILVILPDTLCHCIY